MTRCKQVLLLHKKSFMYRTRRFDHNVAPFLFSTTTFKSITICNAQPCLLNYIWTKNLFRDLTVNYIHRYHRLYVGVVNMKEEAITFLALVLRSRLRIKLAPCKEKAYLLFSSIPVWLYPRNARVIPSLLTSSFSHNQHATLHHTFNPWMPSLRVQYISDI